MMSNDGETGDFYNDANLDDDNGSHKGGLTNFFDQSMVTSMPNVTWDGAYRYNDGNKDRSAQFISLSMKVDGKTKVCYVGQEMKYDNSLPQAEFYEPRHAYSHRVYKDSSHTRYYHVLLKDRHQPLRPPPSLSS
jgi:hypothetical protein